jgi:hypothetical protein
VTCIRNIEKSIRDNSGCGRGCGRGCALAVSCLVFRTQNKDIYNRKADVFIILVLVMF